MIKFAEYQVDLGQEQTISDIESIVGNLLSQSEIQQERRGKVYDLRPLIDDISVSELDDVVVLEMRLAASQEGTGRPDEVLRAMGFEPEQSRIVRTGLVMIKE